MAHDHFWPSTLAYCDWGENPVKLIFLLRVEGVEEGWALVVEERNAQSALVGLVQKIGP